MLINPYYAINLDPGLADQHTPIVDKSQWIRANWRLISELGPEERLSHLLEVLQGDHPRSPNELARKDG